MFKGENCGKKHLKWWNWEEGAVQLYGNGMSAGEQCKHLEVRGPSGKWTCLPGKLFLRKG